MQGTLTTSLLLILLIGMEIAKINASFWLDAGICIVAFLVVVLTYNLTDITISVLLLLLLLLELSCVGGICWGLLLLISLFRVFLSFLFFAGLFRRLACLYRPEWGQSDFFYLMLLRVGVFDSCPLGLHLWSGAIGMAVTSEETDIRVSDYGLRF